MAVIDDKVVAMSFDNSRFESGVNKSLGSIEKLKSSLKFTGAGKGLDDVNAAAGRMNFGHISSALTDISGKLGVLRLTAIGVFANITSSAVRAGMSFAKSFTIEPIKAGLAEYTTNLNSIQTILANTQAEGAKLKDVNKALYELNVYSDKTIYNFSQMARNIGTFTAAGVNLKTSVASIKGIANLAALSGSSAEQASTAMYQLSQAIAAGRVSLQDWNSVVNAGMGGATFQKALANTAVAMGALKDGSVKLVGPMKQLKINGESFRESIGGPGPKWLTSDILTNTLKQFTGDMSVAELKAQGFNAAQIKAIQSTAKVALEAATKVKTLGQVIDVAKETAQSGWAQTWQLIFGDFGEARTLFTNVSNAVNGFINTSANARNKVLKDWKELGGRTALISGIKTAFQALGQIIAPIKDAFREIFPANTGKDLYDATLRFKEFAQALKPSSETVENLHRTFKGLFAALDIGKQIISGIFSVFGKMFGALGGGNGGFLSLTASIGDFLVSIDQALKKGDGLTKFFSGLGAILAAPIKFLSNLAGVLGSLFTGFSSGGFSAQMSGMTKAMTPFQRALQAVADAWRRFLNSFDNSDQVFQGLTNAFTTFAQQLGPALSSAISNINFEAILSVIRTGLLVGLVLMLKKFLGGGAFMDQFANALGKGFGRLGGGIFKNINRSMSSFSGTMRAMQTNLKAKTLKEIAIAIALLAASVLALSLVDPERLNPALSAMTVMFGELIAAMMVLDKYIKTGGALKLVPLAAALMGVAVAIDLLTISVLALSKLSWDELKKGLIGLTTMLGTLSVASIVLSKNSAGLIRAGVGITAIAIGLNIMALAVRQFGSMNLSQLAKGLGAVAISLAIIGKTTAMMPKGMVLQGAGLIAVAVGLNILARAIARIGSLNLQVIGKGLLGIGGGLVVIAGAMKLMPMNMAVTGAGLVIVSLALGKIADAIGKMGAMSIEKIAKGITTLALALGVLAVGLKAMSGTLAGSAALTVAAAGIAVLTPALVSLGKQSWSQIIKSMVALAAAFAVIGVAARLLAPAAPALLAFGVALLAIGAALALAGAGIALIGVGLSAIAVAGPAGIAVLITAMKQFTAAIPEMVTNLVNGLLSMVQAFAKVAPQFVAALVTIIGQLLNVVIQSAPKIAEAFTALITAALIAFYANKDRLIKAGFDLLISLLNGIKNNIAQITVTVAQIIVTMLTSLAGQMGKITTAGAQLLSKFLLGIANNIQTIVTSVGTIVTKFISAMGAQGVNIAKAGTDAIVKFITALGRQAVLMATTVGMVIANFITEVGKQGVNIARAGTDAMIKFINALGREAVRLAEEGAKAIIKFLNGIADAIEKYEPQMLIAGARIGAAIIKGMLNGLNSMAQSIYNKVGEIASTAKRILGKLWKFGSPSRLTYEWGQWIVQGLQYGMEDAAQNMYASTVVFGQRLKQNMRGKLPEEMRTLGQYIAASFAQGLGGNPQEISAAFGELNTKLTDMISTSRQTIISEQKKLKELRDADKPDAKAIAEAQAVIDKNEEVLRRSLATRKLLKTELQDEKKELMSYANQYAIVNAKLAAAQQDLINKIKERDDLVNSLQAKYSALPEIKLTDDQGNPIDPLAAYEKQITDQIAATTAYQETLRQLRELGLDDATYQKLLEEGPADQAFANQLLAGGKTAIEGLNELDKQLQTVSKSLATEAARNLKQAGIDAATGLVQGLKARKKELAQAMHELAQDIITELRKSLGIKSPSKEMADIGGYMVDGLISGIADKAKEAMEAMRRTIKGMADVVNQEFSSEPTITPVLDLTSVKSQSKVLSSVVGSAIAGASSAQAFTISSEQSAARDEAAKAASMPDRTIVFEQKNYSPVALTEIEIYRQTKNQLSQLKSALEFGSVGKPLFDVSV